MGQPTATWQLTRRPGTGSGAGAMGGGGLRGWAQRRVAPLVATVLVLGTALVFSLWWNVHVDHGGVWYEPADLWRTMLASVRLDHGQLSQLYTNGTNLVSFPGAAVILAPAAALTSALNLPLGPPIGTVVDTNAWLIALPYMVLISCSVLFAADRLAERMGASAGKRLLLALAGGAALWNVVPYWGHPEDCVAIALLLFAIDSAAAGRPVRSAWLVGFGLAVQPLVMLAVPILAVVAGGRQIVGWLVRAAVPPAIAVGVALAANWSGTWYQIVDQPNWPYIDRPTPWIGLAPHLTPQTVAAGPGRSIAIVLAIAAAWPAWRAWRRSGGGQPVTAAGRDPAAGHDPASGAPVPADQFAPADQPYAAGPHPVPSPLAPSLASDGVPSDGVPADGVPVARPSGPATLAGAWPAPALGAVVWWVAAALVLRCGFESVMVSYYIWPGIAVGMIAAAATWWRLVPAAALGVGLTAFCNVWWHGEWPWWSVIVITLALLLVVSHPAADRPRQAPAAGGNDPERRLSPWPAEVDSVVHSGSTYLGPASGAGIPAGSGGMAPPAGAGPGPASPPLPPLGGTSST